MNYKVLMGVLSFLGAICHYCCEGPLTKDVRGGSVPDSCIVLYYFLVSVLFSYVSAPLLA